jgi:uncharacterized cupredoxin-like copper-binding protein
MNTPLIVSHTQERTRVPALRKLIIAGLLGNVLVNAGIMALVVRGLIPPLAIIMVLTLVIAGVVATRWRWAPLLAVLFVVASIIPGLQPYTYNLTHPADTGKFIGTVLDFALLLVTVVAGVAATVSGERQVAAGGMPRWLRGFLTGTAAFVLGASLVAIIPQPEASAGVSPAVLAQLPALTTAHDKFDQSELRAKVGETVALRLENSDASGHSFDIDAFNVHVPIPPGKAALALFKPSKPGSYTFYCSVPGHREAGMVGTLIVEP